MQGELDRLPTTARGRVVRAVERLKDEPRPLGCVKLKGFRDEYRIRVGDYRVRYAVDDQQAQITVSRCAHRSDIYRS